MKANTFMKTLSNEQRLKMTHAMKIREYPRNVSIITEGDNGQEMFILERGSILVTKGIGNSSSIAYSSHIRNVNMIWSILFCSYYMVHTIWSISYGPYHMVHTIWSISYGPYHMIHTTLK